MVSECSDQLLKRSEPEREKFDDGSESLTSGSQGLRRHTRVLAASLLLVGVASVVGVGLSIRARIPRRDSTARIGATLPALPVVDISGRVVDAGKARRGKKSIIVFYSPSCDVCHSELPNLQPLPPGLGLIMINVSRTSSEEANTSGLRYDAMFYDQEKLLERSFSMPALPTILFVDEQGVLIAALAGAHQRDVVQNKLNEFARQTAGR